MNKYFKSEDEFQPVDVHDFFQYYNDFFFSGVLEKCTVSWSEKMTLCAGTCTHKGYQTCAIKLSSPLLKYRTPNELKETLLHEMIHAFLFLTNPGACLRQGGHGNEFKEIMKNINGITGLNITIYHTFHDEVDLHRKHIWRCNGRCQSNPPYFGYVKRAMNRKPQAADPWFNDHKRVCGGEFIKMSGPEDKSKKLKQKRQEKRNWGSGKSIADYIKQMAQAEKNKKNPQHLSQIKEKGDQKQNLIIKKENK